MLLRRRTTDVAVQFLAWKLRRKRLYRKGWVVALKLTLASRPGIISLSLCLLLAGCGGGTKQSQLLPPATLRFITPNAAPQIDAGQSVLFTVNEPVTWTLEDNTGRAIKTGLTNETSGTAVYTAPDASTVFSSLQLSVVATLVSDPTQSATMAILVNPALSIVGALSPSNKSCQYDPINQIGTSDGNVGIAYSANRQNPPKPRGGTAPYTWTLNTGLLPAGLSLATTTIAPTVGEAYLLGTPVTPGCFQVTLQVTDATGVSVLSPTYYVIIAPAPLKVSVPNYSDAYTGAPYPPAALSVSGGQPPYNNWNASQLPPGMTLTQSAKDSAAAVLSGVPNGTSQTTYTASVSVFDSQTPYPATGSAALNMYQWLALPSSACDPAQDGGIGGSINTANGSMKGSYAFLFRGFDANGPVIMAGSFAANGAGKITGGGLDVMRTSGSQTAVPISDGSYSLIEQNGSGVTIFEQSGCLALTTSAGTTTFALSMGGCSTSADPGTGTCLADTKGNPGAFTTGRLIEFDDSTGAGTRGSGFLRQQDSSAFAGV